MAIHPYELNLVKEFLNYHGPVYESVLPVKSVEIAEDCISNEYLFFSYLKQGFQVNCSTFFKGSYFRVRYFNYKEGEYWP
jgi:hypothetical protein